jgi:hypothetical protein
MHPCTEVRPTFCHGPLMFKMSKCNVALIAYSCLPISVMRFIPGCNQRACLLACRRKIVTVWTILANHLRQNPQKTRCFTLWGSHRQTRGICDEIVQYATREMIPLWVDCWGLENAEKPFFHFTFKMALDYTRRYFHCE